MRIRKPEINMAVTEQLIWVNDHLHLDGEGLLAPCGACKSLFEYYSREENRHKFYTLLGQKVVPKETVTGEKKAPRRGRKRKASQSTLVKNLERMIAKAASS
jgi:hypothetical protein